MDWAKITTRRDEKALMPPVLEVFTVYAFMCVIHMKNRLFRLFRTNFGDFFYWNTTFLIQEIVFKTVDCKMAAILFLVHSGIYSLGAPDSEVWFLDIIIVSKKEVDIGRLVA